MILVHAYIRRLCRMIAGQGDTYQLAVHYRELVTVFGQLYIASGGVGQECTDLWLVRYHTLNYYYYCFPLHTTSLNISNVYKQLSLLWQHGYPKILLHAEGTGETAALSITHPSSTAVRNHWAYCSRVSKCNVQSMVTLRAGYRLAFW